MIINSYEQNKEKIQCYIPKYECVHVPVYQVMLCRVWLAVVTYTAGHTYW